eukprot:scaffold3934_cov170-Pinguiococcus_pyrenoidosus.AAC.1
MLFRSDDARQHVGKASRRHHNVLANLALRKPEYLPESVKQAQSSFAFPALRAFLPSLLPYVIPQRHRRRKEEAVHAVEAAR